MSQYEDHSAPGPGIHRLPIPVPLPFQYTYAYVLEGPDGFFLVDAGMDVPNARDRWTDFARALGLSANNVHGIFITHYHPDHVGLAGWLAETFEAPVYMLAGEEQTARFLFGGTPLPTDLHHFFEVHGMPPSIIDLLRRQDAQAHHDVHLPAVIHALSDESFLPFGPVRVQVLQQKGHTDHQGVLYLPERRILLTGDQVLARISPNVSLWPYSDPNPLQSYLESLARLLRLPVESGLPAHEGLIPDLPGRIRELLAHHHDRAQTVWNVLDKPLTAYEVAERIFRKDLSPYQMRFALGEALAHLEFLRYAGDLVRDEKTLPWRYHRARAMRKDSPRQGFAEISGTRCLAR